MLFFRSGFIYAAALCLAIQLVSAPTHAQSTNAPVIPTFQVNRYEIVGPTALDQATVDRAMQTAIGTNITAPQIRRALTKLQQAFRDRGYLRATITLPQQSLTDGIVRLNVVPGPNQNEPSPEPVALPAAEPAYNFQHFEIYGNTALQPEEIDRLLSPAAGSAANLDDLEKALTELQRAYRERGYYAATVKLPEQILTDGTVIIQVEEGLTLAAEAALAAERAAARAATNQPAPPRTFEIQHYEILGNSLLSPATIDSIVARGTGTNITFTDVQKVLGDLQLAYRERGFASVKVSLPPQQLTNATVRVQVIEGVLVDARITGNRYFSSNNIMSALPTLAKALVWKDEVVNSRVLQRELDLANQNRDRQIYPIINPGPEPGTTAIELRVKDRLPLHGRLEINNQSTPGTPDWRVNANATYNNLWQLEHQLGVSYGFTPEEFKTDGMVTDYFFNRPLIANYGAYYRLPFGRAESLQERINSSAQFGYDEATRQFRLPPAGARPELTLYLSGSSSDTGVQRGPRTLVGTNNTPEYSLSSQDSGQNFSLTHTYGARLSFPLVINDRVRWSFSGGLDYKTYEVTSYNTNSFYTYEVTEDDITGEVIIEESTIASPQPVRDTEIPYLPLSLGIDFIENDSLGNTIFNLNASYNFVGYTRTYFSGFPLGVNPTNYPSRRTDLNYAKVNLSLLRNQKFFGNTSLLLRFSGQAASESLISNEQFALGGLNSVRGYFEGDEYGDSGWFGSIELRTPFIAGDVPIWSGQVPTWLRGSVFMDVGQRFYLDGATVPETRRTLWGAGFSLSANVNNRVDAKLTLAWPLADSNNTEAGRPRANFSIGAQF